MVARWRRPLWQARRRCGVVRVGSQMPSNGLQRTSGRASSLLQFWRGRWPLTPSVRQRRFACRMRPLHTRFRRPSDLAKQPESDPPSSGPASRCARIPSGLWSRLAPTSRGRPDQLRASATVSDMAGHHRRSLARGESRIRHNLRDSLFGSTRLQQLSGCLPADGR